VKLNITRQSSPPTSAGRRAVDYVVDMRRGLQTQRRLLVLGLSLAICAAALACLAPTGGARQGVGAHLAATAPLGGVNVVSVGPSALSIADKTIQEAQALHAAVIRTDLPWSVIEPQEGQFETRSEAFADRLVSDAAAAGIRVIMTVDSTPCWASSAPAPILHTCSPSRSSAANAWPPANPATYASFVADLATRYGTRLAAIEVWNEPDQANQLYFAGPEKAVRYAAILRAAYPAIKQANPQVPVLAGSLVGSNGIFLRALYAAGIKGYYDGLAVHYYTVTLADLRAIHAVQLANGDTTPLWLDEFGFSNCWPRQKLQQDQPCVTSQTQAGNLVALVRQLAGTPYVAAEAVYKLQDGGPENFGLLTAGGARKPAFNALAKVFASPFGSVSKVTLHLRKAGGHVVASGSGPVGDYLKLEVYKGSVARFYAEFSLNRFNEYSISLPGVLGTHGLRVRVYQYWAGAASAVQKRI